MRATLNAKVRTDDRIAVIYDRASTPNQRDNYSRQDAARLHELAERLGYKWELRQEIKSGENLVNRPVMRQLLEDIADGKVGAIICQDFTRLSRDEDGIDGRIIRQACRDNDCLIITPDKTYDFTLDVDDDLADIGFLIGKIQKRQNLKAMTKGLLEKARQGKVLPTTEKLGYRWTAKDANTGKKVQGADLEVEPTEVSVVQLIFDLYEKMSERQVAKYLNDHQYRRPCKTAGRRQKYNRKDRIYVPRDIHDIIRDPLYTGFVVWGHNCRSRYTKGFEEQRHHRPDLQIISFEQWNGCQKIAKERARFPAKRAFSSPYVFSGLIKCAHCGGNMVGRKQWGERNRKRNLLIKKYVCDRYHRAGKHGCEGQSTRESMVKRAILPFLKDVLSNWLHLDDYFDEAAQTLDTEGREKESHHISEIEDVKSRLANLLEAVETGRLKGADISERRNELMERKERAEKRLKALREGEHLSEEIALALEKVKASFPMIIDDLPDDKLAQLCRMIFARFTAHTKGFGWNPSPEIVSYQFTPQFQQLLAESVHNELKGGDPPCGDVA